jgi:hypothetical protein
VEQRIAHSIIKRKVFQSNAAANRGANPRPGVAANVADHQRPQLKATLCDRKQTTCWLVHPQTV